MAQEPQTITIDGNEYRYADLSEAAQQQINNVSVVDREIARLEQQQALQQTARNAYVRALTDALSKNRQQMH